MDCTIIGIAGGTGSGKSTFTNRIKEKFQNDVTVILYDNYYKRQDHLTPEQRRKTNYDHPDALETDLLIHQLQMLKDGNSIRCPVYDFTKHNRSEEVIETEPSKVVIVEGILTLYNPQLRELFDIKIFVDADSDERILRRVIRDVSERGRSIDNIVEQYLTTVKPMHYQFVEPTKREADLILNSGNNDVAFDIICTKINSILKI